MAHPPLALEARQQGVPGLHRMEHFAVSGVDERQVTRPVKKAAPLGDGPRQVALEPALRRARALASVTFITFTHATSRTQHIIANITGTTTPAS